MTKKRPRSRKKPGRPKLRKYIQTFNTLSDANKTELDILRAQMGLETTVRTLTTPENRATTLASKKTLDKHTQLSIDLHTFVNGQDLVKANIRDLHLKKWASLKVENQDKLVAAFVKFAYNERLKTIRRNFRLQGYPIKWPRLKTMTGKYRSGYLRFKKSLDPAGARRKILQLSGSLYKSLLVSESPQSENFVGDNAFLIGSKNPLLSIHKYGSRKNNLPVRDALQFDEEAYVKKLRAFSNAAFNRNKFK